MLDAFLDAAAARWRSDEPCSSFIAFAAAVVGSFGFSFAELARCRNTRLPNHRARPNGVRCQLAFGTLCAPAKPGAV